MSSVEIKEVDTKEFGKFLDLHHKKVFSKTQFFDFVKVLAPEENKNIKPFVKIYPWVIELIFLFT